MTRSRPLPVDDVLLELAGTMSAAEQQTVRVIINGQAVISELAPAIFTAQSSCCQSTSSCELDASLKANANASLSSLGRKSIAEYLSDNSASNNAASIFAPGYLPSAWHFTALQQLWCALPLVHPTRAYDIPDYQNMSFWRIRRRSAEQLHLTSRSQLSPPPVDSNTHVG